jgi:hypothetical protein
MTNQPNREVTKGDGINFAKAHGMLFMECSAKAKTGVLQAFDELVQKVLSMQCWYLRGIDPGESVACC